MIGELSENLKIIRTGEHLQALHIRGLDALTCKEDIVMAVEARIGSLRGKNFRISELRPNAGVTLAATFMTNEEDAKRLLEGVPLRVGLVNCRIEKRVSVVRCHKCWAYSHKAKECTSLVNRTKLCYRCGEEGHNAKNCTNEESCPVCNETEHTADTRRCREFRRALSQARRNAARREIATRATARPSAPNDRLEIGELREELGREGHLDNQPV